MSPAWRAAVRLARRDLRRHPVRAALTTLLVMLPVFLATVVVLTEHNSTWSPQSQATQVMGQADAWAQTTEFAEVRPREALYGAPMPVRRGKQTPRREAPLSEQALLAALPDGSRLVPAPQRGWVELESGGFATVLTAAPDPVSEGLVDLRSGRLPQSPDEVVLERFAADELGLITAEDAPRAGAEVSLADGRSLALVGTTGQDRESGLVLVAGSGFDVGPQPGEVAGSFLVVLPGGEVVTRSLVNELATLGVALQPRTALTDPDAWGLEFGDPRDVEAVILGGVVMLVGLLEIMLLVGASFAVAARRQVRDLGLVSANGGTGRDLRRQMLAQGAVLGLGATLLGSAAGVAIYLWGARGMADLAGWQVYTREIPWPAVAVIAALGAASAVVAALIPARTVTRLTPMQSLNGAFPVSAARPADRRKALVLAGCGLALLAAGGWSTSRWFAPGGSQQALGPFISGLGLLVLVGGLVWASAYVVHLISRAGTRLPLSGRFAFRAAGRHRGRTAAAATGLMMTVALAVMAGFVFSSVAANIAGPQGHLDHAVYIEGEFGAMDADRVEPTAEKVLGPVDLLVSQSIGAPGDRRRHTLGVSRGGWPEIRQIDQSGLERLAGEPLDDDVVQSFRQGGVVVLEGLSMPSRRQAAELVVRLRGDDGVQRWTLPATYVETERASGSFYVGEAFVAAGTVSELGLEAANASIVALAGRAVTQSDLRRLEAYGLQTYSDEPGAVVADRMQWAGVGIAGLLALLVVGVSVALASAEGRDEAATLSAVGAGPLRHRSIGAMHGLFIGLAGTALGLVVGLPAGAAFLQLDGRAGTDIPWPSFLGTAVAVVLLSPVAGWLVTPHRVVASRRTA